MTSNSKKWDALKAAFPRTIPVMIAYGSLGMIFGVLMNVAGFNFLYPTIMSLTIVGGSLQFLAVSLLQASFAPAQIVLMTLLLQARHLFYGISMLEKYKGTGWKKPYLIYVLTDETFSITCSAGIPEGIDKGWFYFFTSLLDHAYWVIASLIGGLLGSLLTFNTEGLDFAMTAMFVVIFLEQLMKEKKHYTAAIGLISSLVCLIIFGTDVFLIPTMICMLILLTIFRKPIERSGDFNDNEFE